MQKTHWKRLINPDYLGAYSLEPGKDMVLTIKSVVREMIIGVEGKKSEETVIHFAEPQKPMILNRTNQKTIQKVYKTPYIEDWAGKRIQLYSAEVKAFGEVVDALRIRPFPPKEAPSAGVAETCQDCGKQVAAAGKMTAGMVAEYARKKFGVTLCTDCGKARSEALKSADEGETAGEGQADV